MLLQKAIWVRDIATVWHENLTVIKFYGLYMLCKLKNFTDYNFIDAYVVEAHFNTSARAENGIDHQ